MTPTPIHPYSGQQGWKNLPQFNYQMLLTPANQGLQQKGSLFSKILMLSRRKCTFNKN